MVPPFFRVGSKVTTYKEVAARECLRRGWRSLILPPGTYTVAEIWRDEECWHNHERSDGYTYRICAVLEGRRIRASVWQNDLMEAIQHRENDSP